MGKRNHTSDAYLSRQTTTSGDNVACLKDRSRSTRKNKTAGESLSQPSNNRRYVARNATNLSQPVPDTSANNSASILEHENNGKERSFRLKTQRSSSLGIFSEEEDQMVGSVIRYIFMLDRGKQAINKTHVIRNVLGGQVKYYSSVMAKAKNLLSKIFGYKLVELESNKYIVVNRIENDLPQVRTTKTESARQLLLFVTLTHIFMNGETCSEESLWNFLAHLNILDTDEQPHERFGNVRQLIKEEFVAQRYLDCIVPAKSEPLKLEFKWGPRAEHEFSRRAALEFVCQVYACPMNSWPLQFKALTAREESEDS